MISFKKVYKDELLQLALILSLLRVNQDTFYENDIHNNVNYLDLDNGTSWRSLSHLVLRSHFVHPKNLDTVLLDYEGVLFADLNSLGRFNPSTFRNPDVTAYLLNIERGAGGINPTEPLPTPPQDPTEDDASSNEATANPLEVNLELSQEDMDLIEVLWKQDVDLGFSLDASNAKVEKAELEDVKNDTQESPSTFTRHDDLEKLKTLKAINEEKKIKEEPENEQTEEDIWAGLDYTIDTETGEYVIKGELNESLAGGDSGACDLPLGDFLPLPEFLLDEALRLVDFDDDSSQGQSLNIKEIENLSLDPNNVTASTSGEAAAAVPAESGLLDVANKETEDDLNFFTNMIQTPQFHHPHHRAAFQSRMPFVRTMSMEQRWQDLANLLSLPSPSDATSLHPHPHPHPFGPHPALQNYGPPHAHSMGYGGDAAARGVLLHNATLTPPVGDLNATVPYSNLGDTNLGNAVATSMNLTNSSEPMAEPSSASHYKLEPSHDMMYYQNGTGSEMNQTDGFFPPILNDEELQLMDMAMNEGMYTMRMLDGNNAISNLSISGNTTTNSTNLSRTDMERLDTSSDSAVSSMGSERVPSLSDGEWCDGGSDSGHTTTTTATTTTTTGEHYVTDYHHNKFRPYNYSYSRHLSNDLAARMPPVAQKKHQMYGKRYFQEHGAGSASAAIHQPHTPIKYEYRDAATASFSSPAQPEGAVGPKMPEMKYSCSVEFGRQSHMVRGASAIDHIQHNHTYHLPAENTGALQRPLSRDKSKGKKADEEHLSRDEKRARALNVPISVDDIINLPMDEFNERLSKYDLSEAQLSLIRDIRRRGKNKVAAQNCRKRKLDQILSLADEVKEMRDRKIRLNNDHEYAVAECKRMNDKYQQLYRHVFRNLRDADGNQYSPYQYSLQISADGTVLMVPRSNSTMNPERKEPPQNHKE